MASPRCTDRSGHPGRGNTPDTTLLELSGVVIRGTLSKPTKDLEAAIDG